MKEYGTPMFLAGIAVGAIGPMIAGLPTGGGNPPPAPMVVGGTVSHDAASMAEETGGSPDVEEMLWDFVDDFCTDRQARPLVFGIEVRDAQPSRWHVVVEESEDGSGGHEAFLEPDFPDEPVPYYTTDTATLSAVHGDEMACLTAMGKTFSTDFAPLDLVEPEGFEPDAELADYLIIHPFHFWTRGFPERIRFGSLDRARSGHGGSATLFYYSEDSVPATSPSSRVSTSMPTRDRAAIPSPACSSSLPVEPRRASVAPSASCRPAKPSTSAPTSTTSSGSTRTHPKTRRVSSSCSARGLERCGDAAIRCQARFARHSLFGSDVVRRGSIGMTRESCLTPYRWG